MGLAAARGVIVISRTDRYNTRMNNEHTLHRQLSGTFGTLMHHEFTVKDDIYKPFAIEEWLCRQVGEGVVRPLLHVWRHERAFVLGLRDARLPHAAEAMRWLAGEGFRVMVRNSGGAAVPLDAGVVNITWIQPLQQGDLRPQRDFELAAAWLQDELRRYGLSCDIGEVEGSYCPGDFDVSVRGRKFCGMAQRRLQKAFSVQAFVNVEGSAGERAEWARRFYERAAGGEAHAGALSVHAERMGSLRDLASGFPGAEQWIAELKRPHAQWTLPPIDASVVSEIVDRLKRRYDPRV